MTDTLNPYLAFGIIAAVILPASWFTFHRLWRPAKTIQEYWIYIAGVRGFGLASGVLLFLGLGWKSFPELIHGDPPRVAIAVALDLVLSATMGMWLGFIWGWAMSRRMTGGS